MIGPFLFAVSVWTRDQVILDRSGLKESKENFLDLKVNDRCGIGRHRKVFNRFFSYCPGGTVCEISKTTGKYTCQKGLPLGSECSEDSPCASDNCVSPGEAFNTKICVPDCLNGPEKEKKSYHGVKIEWIKIKFDFCICGTQDDEKTICSKTEDHNMCILPEYKMGPSGDDGCLALVEM